MIFDWMRKRRAPLPQVLVLETTSFCNLRCRMCPKTHGAVNTAPNRVMAREVFDRVAELLPYVRRVELSGLWGEAFLHPDLYFGMLHDLKAFPRLHVSTITNGTLLKDDLCRRLVEEGLDHLTVSLDAARPETYAAIREGGRMADVLAALASLRDWKTKLGKTKPDVDLTFVGMKSNIREFPDLVRRAGDWGVRKVVLQALGEYGSVLGESVAAHDKETGRAVFAEAQRAGQERGVQVELFPPDQFEETRGGRNQPAPDQAGLWKNCLEPWTSVVVTASGDVLPCCSSDRPMGNLRERSFRAIWNTREYAGLRAALRSAHPPRMCAVCTGKEWVPAPRHPFLRHVLVVGALQAERTFGRWPGYRPLSRRARKILDRLTRRPPA